MVLTDARRHVVSVALAQVADDAGQRLAGRGTTLELGPQVLPVVGARRPALGMPRSAASAPNRSRAPGGPDAGSADAVRRLPAPLRDGPSLPLRIDRGAMDTWIVQRAEPTRGTSGTSTTAVGSSAGITDAELPGGRDLAVLVRAIDMRPASIDGASRRARRASRIRAMVDACRATGACLGGIGPSCDGTQAATACNRPPHVGGRHRLARRGTCGTWAARGCASSSRWAERGAANGRYTALARPCTRPARPRLGQRHNPMGSRSPGRAPSRRCPGRAGNPPASQVQREAEPRQGGALRCRRCDLPRPRRDDPLAPAVLEAMLPFFTERFGNASEPHWAGRAARAGLSEARARVAGVLGVAPHEVVFTGGGSESDNIAIPAARRAARAAWSRAPSSIPRSGSPCVPSPRAGGTSSGRRSTRRACSISAPSPTSCCRATRWPA